MARFKARYDYFEVEESGGWGSETARIFYILDTETDTRTDEISAPSLFASFARSRGIDASATYAKQLAEELNGAVEDGDTETIERIQHDYPFDVFPGYRAGTRLLDTGDV